MHGPDRFNRGTGSVDGLDAMPSVDGRADIWPAQGVSGSWDLMHSSG